MAPKKLLLAEDDGDDQQLFRDFLVHRRDVTLMPIAENGVELLAALELIKHANDLPSIIILDHNMPRLNGLQTLQILKREKRYSHIPVIVYSTYVDDDLIRETIRLRSTGSILCVSLVALEYVSRSSISWFILSAAEIERSK